MILRPCFAMIVFVLQFATASAAGNAQPQHGSLIICGGGRMPDPITDRFVELAGGKDARLVVIPTASSDQALPTLDEVRNTWQSREIGQVSMLHTRNRERADDAQFVEPLNDATAVWFNGGQQSRIAAAYVGTAVEAELYKLLKRGGTIGGTSAGAAIQSKVMIQSGAREPDIGQGFDLLKNAIVDQHFLQRNRLARSIAAVRAHPKCIGIGIDEGTAVVVTGDKMQVVGNSYVLITRLDSESRKIAIDCYGHRENIPMSKMNVGIHGQLSN